MEYILGKKQKGCFFCKKPLEEKDEVNLILYQGRYAFVMMNRFPYNNGHLMVAPKRHCLNLEELSDKEMREVFFLITTSIQILKKNLQPDGFNIGINMGKVGGAGEEHIHFHIVPRWTGDTNFMPVLGETKIIPEYLEKTFRRLHTDFAHMFQKKRGKKGVRKR
jgi:ATP adenylyltransferase